MAKSKKWYKVTDTDGRIYKERGGGFMIAENPNDSLSSHEFIPCLILEVKPVGLIYDLRYSDCKMVDSMKVVKELNKAEMNEVLGWSYSRLMKFVKYCSRTKHKKPDGRPDPNWKLFTAASWDAARELAAYNIPTGGGGWRTKVDHVDEEMKRSFEEHHLSCWRAVSIFVGQFSGLYGHTLEDAERYAFSILLKNTSFPKEHHDYIAKRWGVWQKGYGLLGEYGKTFYVYGTN